MVSVMNDTSCIVYNLWKISEIVGKISARYLVGFRDGFVVAVESPLEWYRREVHGHPRRDEDCVEDQAEDDLALAVPGHCC